MEMPQEIIVWYLLPALRKGLVVELKKHGMQQNEIADKMRITGAAVSQYLHNKRGSQDLKLGKIMKAEIKKSALRLKDSKDKDAIMKELIRLVNKSNKERIVCAKCTLKNNYCNIC
jgi:predicted transcriptional regulator